MSGSYVPFIDWLKALGMLLILYGHVAGWAPLTSLPPIYTKQLGVACFLFASGYSLAGETRDRWRVAFNRLFEVYLFGLACAVVISLVLLGQGLRPQPSNYLPFMAGVNVVLDNFPANPTTWYLGTYVHVIVLWTLVGRRLRVTPAVLVGSVAVEVLVRATLIATAGSFVAYMALPNWLTVFLLGCWQRQREARLPSAAGPSRRGSGQHWLALGALVTVVVGWWIVSTRLPFERGIPFLRLRGLGFSGTLAVSAMVSTLYAGLTWLIFRSVQPLSAPRPVRFVARNTLVIFLAHMPIYYALTPFVRSWTSNRTVGSAVYMLVCLPGLAWMSEVVRRRVPVRAWRSRAFTLAEERLLGRRDPAAAEPSSAKTTHH